MGTEALLPLLDPRGTARRKNKKQKTEKCPSSQTKSFIMIKKDDKDNKVSWTRWCTAALINTALACSEAMMLGYVQEKAPIWFLCPRWWRHRAACGLRWGALQVKALQGDVEEVSPHILHSLLLLFIFLAAFLPVRLQLVSASPPPPPPQVTSPANQILLHTFIFHCSPPPQPLLFPLFLFFPFLHSFPSPTPPLVSHLVSCFLPFFLCSSVSRSLPVNLLIAH